LALQRAQVALESLPAGSTPPVDALPSAAHGIGIVWELNGRYADVEFFNNGQIGAVVDDYKGGLMGWEIRDGGTSFRFGSNRGISE